MDQRSLLKKKKLGASQNIRFRKTKVLCEAAKNREIELYRWHLEYFQVNMPNSWSSIAKKINTATPSFLKNLFYSHAMSSLRRILSMIAYDRCELLDQIRISYFLILATEYLQYNKIGSSRNDHFMKLLIQYNVTQDALLKYKEINHIKEDKCSLKSKICGILKTECTPLKETLIRGIIDNALQLPIDNNKTLEKPVDLELYCTKYSLPHINVDMVDDLTYFLQFPAQVIHYESDL